MISPEAYTNFPIVHVISHDKYLYLRMKRSLDLCCAIVLLVVLSPLLLVIAICIKLDSPGPVFFKQIRSGQNRRKVDRRGQVYPTGSISPEKRAGMDRREKDAIGRPFGFYKFRTMHVNNDSGLHRQFVERYIKNQIADSGDAVSSVSPKFKIDGDPRVTRVGRFLRRTSLDELPQLFNMLKGEMSLIGPRPPIPYEVEHYATWHRKRLYVLPGITGLWQVKGRSRVTFDEMVRLDLFYIEHLSLALDVKILLLTPWAIISGNGAV